ncbi:MAG TPA: family 20 glycosylhydrolase [Chitinophagaceae bacterium]|nr:family 20 glycosylhydrolase [Chitinophagaceae bacterium]
MKCSVVFICLVLLGAITVAQNRINIIPKPLQLTEQKGEFRYNPGTIIYSVPEYRQTALYLAEILRIPPVNVQSIKPGAEPTTGIMLKKTAGEDSASYQLSITEKKITSLSSQPLGALYAAQTLAQMALTSKTGTLPCAEIKDKPRFGYRGMMLDVSRNFYSVEYIRKLLNLLSIYKINTFHWHLTDGAGWRLEIKKYPELTAKSAWRTHKTWKEWWSGNREYGRENDPTSYGGYYTQQQAREIVAFAKTRGITVIPEIEMPGHSEEVTAAYPHLGCTSAKGNPGELCIGNDSTFILMQDVITEVIDIFPSTYIHIGGDEAGKDNWKKCSKCQKRIKDNNLKDEYELQSYMIRRMEKFISSKGRKLLGWDEILEGGLAPGSTVMSWRGEQGGIEAANMNHDVIMTPGNFCYFDKYQQEPAGEPEAIGGYLPLQKVYAYEPIPAALAKDKHHFVKGAQANLWTEYISSMEHVDYMLFPRIIALSEVLWSDPGGRNWEDFKSRLYRHYGLLQKLNVNYCRPSDKVEIRPRIDPLTKTAIVTLNTEQYKPQIRYTTDGTKPGIDSKIYAGNFEVVGTSNVKASVMRNNKTTRVDTLLLDFHKALGKKVTYNKSWNSSYPAQKESTLVNGYKGTLTYQDNQWQGFTTDMDVVIDLGESQTLSTVSATFMQVTGPGVYMPDYVEVSISGDGKDFLSVGKALNDIPTTDPSLIFKTFKVDTGKLPGRYIRFYAKNHTGFLFADEIVVY